MIQIEYPEQEFNIRMGEKAREVWDPWRRKWVKLTPEEWVRLNFVNYLEKVMKYPAELIAIEKAFQQGELRKRFDVLVYNSKLEPWVLVECKAMEVPLTGEVLFQALRYGSVIEAAYYVITNGLTCKCWRRQNNKLTELSFLPEWVAGDFA